MEALTMAQVTALPPVIDIVTAGRALGIGRSKAYVLARRGEFPCRVIKTGGSYRVPTAGLFELLGVVREVAGQGVLDQ